MDASPTNPVRFYLKPFVSEPREFAEYWPRCPACGKTTYGDTVATGVALWHASCYDEANRKVAA